MTYQAIANKLGCSEPAARQVAYTALRKIRRNFPYTLQLLRLVIEEREMLRRQRESEAA